MDDKLIQNKIDGCIDDLKRLVLQEGFRLSDPNVVRKSAELDALILQVMKPMRSKHCP